MCLMSGIAFLLGLPQHLTKQFLDVLLIVIFLLGEVMQ